MAATAKTTKTTKKTPVKGKAAPKKNGSKAAPAPPVKKQHRELWVILLFLTGLILVLAAFGIKGVVLEALSAFCRGILGFGAYVLPISVLAASLIILFAHGKPVASRLVCDFLLPVLLGMLVHLIFSDLTLTKHVIPTLYATGQTWDSGGVIAGGLAAALGAAISDVGGVIIVILILVYCFMRLCSIKLADVFEYFVGARDEALERREVRRKERREYEDAEEERRAAEEARAADEARRIAAQPHPKLEAPPQPAVEPKKKKKAYDIPLDPLPAEEAPEPVTEPEPIAEPEPIKRVPLPENERRIVECEPEDQRPPEPAQAPSIDVAAADFNGAEDFDDPDDLDEAQNEDDLDEPPFDVETETLPTETLPLIRHAYEGGPQPEAEPIVVDTHQLSDEADKAGEAALALAQATAVKEYRFPSVDMLHEGDYLPSDDATEELRTRSHKLADTLQSFGVKAQISNVIRGPSVTRYEIMLERGVKYSRLTSLQDDIALALGASGVRIAAIPDKFAVGIEVPNKVIQTVYLRDVLTSKSMADNKSKLAFALGKDITGASIIGEIGKMPHMLIAGTTGSGKSVCINSIIVSILYRASPEEVKLIMIDPKMVELGSYNGIPHLLVPVVTDYKKAAGALNWAVMEMDRRYKQLFDVGARDIDSYNRIMEKRGEPRLPRIVILIDELADLMMMAAKEIEESICRIAQKARAAGMHLIIATQRPSVDVLTGIMKSNISSRIAFAVASSVESRIILDQSGAEKLIGRGDMLFFPLGFPKPVRVQGCYLSTEEVESVTEFIKASGEAVYSDEIIQHMERSASKDDEAGDEGEDEADEMFFEAVDVVMQGGQASATMLQRRLRLGYARASRIIDQMESRGIIGPFDGARPRQLLMSKSDWQEMKARRSI